MLTIHAQHRSQQRAIPQAAIDLLLDYGVIEHCSSGLELLYFNKKAKHAITSLMKNSRLKQSDHFFNVFMLESSDGEIVTVGHRIKKINRN